MEASAAERARSAVAASSVATLLTYERRACSGPPTVRQTLVGVRDLGDGGVQVCLRADSDAVRHLCQRPRASVSLAAAGHDRVVIAGSCLRMPGRDAQGRMRFRVEPLSVKIGDRPEPVSLRSYLAASPDPLASQSEAFVRHLSAAHGDALLACVRSQLNPWAALVEPVALDRYGLRLLVVDEEGVSQARLSFPEPVHCLTDLPPGLRVLLACSQDCRE